MSVYGMGSLFCGTEEQLDNFVNEGFVCIGWKKEDKPELYAILNISSKLIITSCLAIVK